MNTHMEVAMVRALKSLPVLRSDVPRTRGDCLDGGVNAERPCRYTFCRHHLLRDTYDRRLKYTPSIEDVDDMDDTCALDVADRGAHTLEEVAGTLKLTRERIRQVEVVALVKMRGVRDFGDSWADVFSQLRGFGASRE